MSKLTDCAAWKNLKVHQIGTKNIPLISLFEKDPDRFNRHHVKLDGVLFDYSKTHITMETRDLLLDLARTQGVEQMRDRMFAGDYINISDDRPVLHTALRRPVTDTIIVSGQNILPKIADVLTHMRDFSDHIRNGQWRGYGGEAIHDVVNIGIGGSDLGPAMACMALAPHASGPRIHFVSNVDGAHIHSVIKDLNPATTLFLIASKTFTTQETMANAGVARDWILASAPDHTAIARHFVALSTNTDAVRAFGIDPVNIFPFWDWVGGRYSIWSSIGLSLCLSIGFEKFRAFLDGAHAVDQHFQTAPLDQNIPVLMALIGIWYRNFQDAPALAVLPYDQRLARFPAYLQQLDMESNGKSVDRDGSPVDYMTGPIIFGEPGTNGQHSFYQLLHQGTHLIPCDFLCVRTPDHPYIDLHRKLLANALAQPQALMKGQTHEQAKGDLSHVFEGNRPSTMIVLDRLDPRTLGMLIALYEHKVFVQGIIWNLNSFNQPGVTLGKKLAEDLIKNWESDLDGADSSTRNLLLTCLR